MSPAEQAPRANPSLPAAGDALPKSLGLCADELHRVREIRLALDKLAEGVKARETELGEHLINSLSKSDDTGVAGLKFRAQVKMKDVPKAADWPAFHAYIAKTGSFDLLQKRLSDKAVTDRLDDGVKLPGIEIMHVPSVSITKI
jgi:hypothetical protein